MKKILATAALLTIAATGTVSCSSTQTAGADNQSLTASTEDLFKPGAEMLFLSNCEDLDNATLTTSFGAETKLSPMADTAQLGGYITAPVNIGPGPDDGYHTYTVHCGDQSATFRFGNDTNGAAQDSEAK